MANIRDLYVQVNAAFQSMQRVQIVKIDQSHDGFSSHPRLRAPEVD